MQLTITKLKGLNTIFHEIDNSVLFLRVDSGLPCLKNYFDSRLDLWGCMFHVSAPPTSLNINNKKF
jgi:hypothetical protein